jgi:drug/metabolite transporter (DMT)-like permease
MIPAFLATLLFSLSVLAANRTTRVLGGMTANFLRLCLATLFLGLWAHTAGQGFAGGAFGWFFLSGVVGFGFGDIALYQALPRIGPRLSILFVQCLAAPFAATAEWLWMDTTLSLRQLLLAMIILLGVAIAIAPKDHVRIGRNTLIAGVALGVLAALGQGLGAVISRKAYSSVALGSWEIDGLTAAYQRILGGLFFAAIPSLWFMLKEWLRSRENRRAWSPFPSPPPRQHAIWPWVLINSLAGPTLGVGCYQWALSLQPSGVVLPIVATTPIMVIPFAWLIDRDKPSLRSVLGGLVAVVGAAALAASV